MPIYGTPGLTLINSVTNGPVRGGIVLNLVQGGGTYIFLVAGTKFWAINPAGTLVDGGNILNGSGPVYFSWNGTQLFFVDGKQGWMYPPFTAPLAQIVDVDFPVPPAGPTTCTWLGGYFFVTKAGSNKIQISALNDCTSWNALDFFNAETAPDNVVRIEADQGELVLFSDRTVEWWALSGDAAIVRRVGSSGIEWGCVAGETVAKFSNGLCFLAQNRQGEVQVGVLAGHQFNAISADDPEINHELNNRSPTILGAATAFSYFMDGHSFYQLNFSDASYLYDDMTKSWSRVTSGTFGSRHYANLRLAFAQQPYVVDYRNGNIYLLDKTNYTDNGDVQQFEITSKHIFNAGNEISVNELTVEIEAGDGLATGQGSDPQIMVSWSKDGGRTWGNEVWMPMGKIGEYRRRATLRNLGRARDWAFKFRISDPIPRKLVSAEVMLEP